MHEFKLRTDRLDAETAWGIQHQTYGKLRHHVGCRSLVAVLLCNCPALPLEWARRAIQQEPERETEILTILKSSMPLELNSYLPDELCRWRNEDRHDQRSTLRHPG